MGTRADFYVGRDPATMEWLGSIAWDGHPPSMPPKLLRSKTKRQFRKRLAKFAATRDDWTDPERGWPWPWSDSSTTDYAYAFDPEDGIVWASWGEFWFVAAETEPQEHDGYPDMSDRKAVAMGKRSGLVMLGDPNADR